MTEEELELISKYLGKGLQKNATVAPTGFEAFLGPVGASLGVVGQGLNIYNAFKAQDNADRAYKQQQEAYEAALDQQRLTNKRNERAQQTQDTYTGSQFATALDDTQDKYRAFLKTIHG